MSGQAGASTRYRQGLARGSIAVAAVLWIPAAIASATDDPGGRKYFYEDILLPFFALDRTAGVYRPQRPDSGAAPFAAEKPLGTFRVFVVGGSIADEFMENPHGLDEALAAALPGLKVEVVNTGMPGYDSFREKAIVEEVLAYSPDALVLLTGHNESPAHRPLPYWRLKLAETLGPWLPKRPPGLEPADDSLVRRNFEENLRAMLASARGRGVPMIVCLPPVNYRDAPARTSPEAFDARFLHGWIAYVRGDCGAASSEWGKGVVADRPASPWALFYSGRCAEKQGRREAARKLYLAASDTGWQGCPPRCQEIIRRIALEQGAVLAEVDEAFRRAAPGVMPGLEMFADTVHWHPEHNPLVSLAILRAMTDAMDLPWDRERLANLTATWSRGAVDRSDARLGTTFKYALRGLSRDPPGLDWLALSYIEYIHARRPGWFDDLEGTAARLKREMEASGREWNAPPIDKASFHWHFGEVLLRKGRYPESQRQFDLAVKARPSLRDPVLLSRAVAWALGGDPRRAVQALADAARSPDAGTAQRAAALARALRLELNRPGQRPDRPAGSTGRRTFKGISPAETRY